MNISFAWTTKALLDGKKTVTRRGWQDDYARRFPPGSVHTATDRQLRYGGKRIGRIRIVTIRREALSLLTMDPDYGRKELELEGGLWESVEEFVAGFTSRDMYNPYRVEFEWLGPDLPPRAQQLTLLPTVEET